MVGMDGIDQPMAIAWASNKPSNDAIPLPGFAVVEDSECNGHGWIMGSAVERIACAMLATNGPKTICSHAFLLNLEPEYTVGHFAYTYILDEDKKPRVRYVDDSWLASDFVEDVVELAEREGIISNESEGIPSVGLLISSQSSHGCHFPALKI